MDSSSLIIRKARPEDDKRIGDILVAAFVEQYARKMPEVVVHDARKSDLRNVAEKREAGIVLVADLNGEVVGSVTLLGPDAERSEAWKPAQADIRMLGIDLRYRGQNISHRILDAAERIVQDEWGCALIGLHVRRGAHGVARLYTTRGYVRDPSGDIDKLPEIYLEAYFKSLKAGESGK